MTKNLLRLLATVTVAGLLVGCGSSSSSNGDTTNSTTGSTTSGDTSTDGSSTIADTIYPNNVALSDDNKTLMFGVEKLTTSSLKIADDNTTVIGTDGNYSIDNLYYANGALSVISDSNASMISAIDSNVTATTPVVDDNTTTVPVTDGNKILPF